LRDIVHVCTSTCAPRCHADRYIYNRRKRVEALKAWQRLRPERGGPKQVSFSVLLCHPLSVWRSPMYRLVFPPWHWYHLRCTGTNVSGMTTSGLTNAIVQHLPIFLHREATTSELDPESGSLLVEPQIIPGRYMLDLRCMWIPNAVFFRQVISHISTLFLFTSSTSLFFSRPVELSGLPLSRMPVFLGSSGWFPCDLPAPRRRLACLLLSCAT